jgi:hypothetical protein
MSYFPELLTPPIFSQITSNAALSPLIAYPTPQQLAQLSVSELTQFLSDHSKNHLGEEYTLKEGWESTGNRSEH